MENNSNTLPPIPLTTIDPTIGKVINDPVLTNLLSLEMKMNIAREEADRNEREFDKQIFETMTKLKCIPNTVDWLDSPAASKIKRSQCYQAIISALMDKHLGVTNGT
jgi:hypothetical protein